MKNKIVTIFVLISLVLPSVSHALIIVPTANLTIVVNTQGQDSPFAFDLTDGEQFNLQTENLSASQTVSIVAFGSQYFLTQERVEGLKLKDINCVSDKQSDTISYTLDSVIFSPTIGENIICTFNNARRNTPILIVPGLTGTELKNGNELLWSDLSRMAVDLSDGFMDILQFEKDLSPTVLGVSSGEVIKKLTVPLGLGSFNYTDSLITEFKNQGYIENETLFTFPYDWRYGVTGKYPDNKTNADLLKEKIQQILTQTGSDKIDVVAHSMGGLIVKKYVMDNSATSQIGKAVFVGVPSTGAPYAVKDLLVGDDLGSFFVSQDEIKKISANMPAIYDLLPSQQYYDVKGSYVKVIDQGFTGLFTTTKDLTHDEVGSFLTNDYGLNATALANAENLHTASFDNFDLRTAGVDLYAIDGCRAGTLGNITEIKSKTIIGAPVISYRSPKFVPGDGTVPLESSTNLPIDQNKKYYTLLEKNSFITGEDKMGVHSHLLSNDGTRQEIVNLISGSSLPVDDKIVTQDISRCNLNGKAISVFSPVNIFVTDQDGNEIGLADDGSIINEIPSANFEIWGEHKFLYLPTDDGQTYDIKIKGTGVGTYTIDSQNIVNGDVTGTEVFSNLPVTTALTGSVNLGAGQTTLTVQQDSGSALQTILPSATVDAVGSQDVLPPVSTATLSGAQDANGNYTGDVAVNVKASDDVAGVLNISYVLDGADLQKVAGGSVDVTVSGEGNHVVSFFSTDKAGNNEAVQEINFVIKKPVIVAPPAPPADTPTHSPAGGGGGTIVVMPNLPAQNPIAPPAPTLKEALAPVLQLSAITKAVSPKALATTKKLKPPTSQALVQDYQPPKPINPTVVAATANPFLGSLLGLSGWIMQLFFHK